eukprot:TRINITY_DN5224_c0_g1_i1.p2 TRINITY_DN5224_c0_g1~~TRINITY_DN5224_c0_g1_i1.p2  ORF type:complete len:373 (+),score=125.49 TRINITY_DN5224_c0_g1_i1:1270-2388(+)
MLPRVGPLMRCALRQRRRFAGSSSGTPLASAVLAEVQRLTEQCVAADAELERLRLENKQLRDAAAASPAAVGDGELQRLRKENQELSTAAAQWVRGWVPPGHFYSPVPDLDEVRRRDAELFPAQPRRDIPAVDLNEAEQLTVLAEMAALYPTMPFGPMPAQGLRYFFENPNYSYHDGVALSGMLRRLRPRRVVEVGSGFSSLCTLDTVDRFLGGSSAVRCTFIDVDHSLLSMFLSDAERSGLDIRAQPLQDVAMDVFTSLEANDVLFIDSTHCCKIGSDVNRLVHEVLPALASGVHVHFHDIFHPFQYPREWVHEGKGWNEAYLLRAFLQYNSAFKVVYFNTYLDMFHGEKLYSAMPICRKNPGGSLWLRRV